MREKKNAMKESAGGLPGERSRAIIVGLPLGPEEAWEEAGMKTGLAPELLEAAKALALIGLYWEATPEEKVSGSLGAFLAKTPLLWRMLENTFEDNPYRREVLSSVGSYLARKEVKDLLEEEGLREVLAAREVVAREVLQEGPVEAWEEAFDVAVTDKDFYSSDSIIPGLNKVLGRYLRGEDPLFKSRAFYKPSALVVTEEEAVFEQDFSGEEVLMDEDGFFEEVDEEAFFEEDELMFSLPEYFFAPGGIHGLEEEVLAQRLRQAKTKGKARSKNKQARKARKKSRKA